ncbi:MAG TPA: PAS domain S-box protein [Rhodocyclaceae bacterium]|nr:PAS domain S-box protein [Rhodocyclaceae bacterium]
MNISPESCTDCLDAAHWRTLVALAADFVWQTDARHRFTLFAATSPELALAVPAPSGLAGEQVDWEPYPDGAAHAWRGRLDRHQPVRLVLGARIAQGAVRYLELIGQPCSIDGRFAGYVGVAHDVTRRIETERALLDSQARHQEVIDSLREVVFRTDADQRFTFLSHAWREITNHAAAASIGRPLADFVHPDERRALALALGQLLAGKLPEYRGQLRLSTDTGEIRWVEASARRVRNGATEAGRSVALIGTLADISSRKIAEMTLRNVNYELEARVRMRTAELEASNHELEAFSYSVSHDLRAPLRSIDGFARILEEELGERLDASSRSHLERIRRAAGRMAYLIDNLLELARLSRHALRKENVNLSEIALQIVDDLRHEDPAREVEFEITGGLMATCDKTLMRVVLDNLLRNAWKFSARRRPAHIGFGANRSGARIVFSVSDNGVGFDMAFATQLFRAFHRLHDHEEFQGSGIGLANVQRIIQRHGGQIWASSAPDQGATFYFTLDASL